MIRPFERFVAIGDSTAEGVGDPGDHGHRGFADRLAERIAAHQSSLAYANLAVSGSTTREIKDRQLAPALALRPDLVAIMAGMNDLLRTRFDASAIGADIAEMQQAFLASGCVVIAFTVPDVAHRLVIPPIDRALSRRARALNDAIRNASRGALLIDLAAHPMATDPRLWNRDRLHGNAEAHERIAAACAEALAVPGATSWWREPLSVLSPTGIGVRLAEDLAWGRQYLVPWLWNRMRGRPGLAQRVAKRPALSLVEI